MCCSRYIAEPEMQRLVIIGARGGHGLRCSRLGIVLVSWRPRDPVRRRLGELVGARRGRRSLKQRRARSLPAMTGRRRHSCCRKRRPSAASVQQQLTLCRVSLAQCAADVLRHQGVSVRSFCLSCVLVATSWFPQLSIDEFVFLRHARGRQRAARAEHRAATDLVERAPEAAQRLSGCARSCS